MSNHTELEVYKDQYKLLTEIINTIKHIRKDFKRTVGEQLRLTASENVFLIQKANVHRKNPEKRLECLEKLKDNNDLLFVVIRSSKDSGVIPLKAYARLVEPLMSVQQQSRKWYNATLKKVNES